MAVYGVSPPSATANVFFFHVQKLYEKKTCATTHGDFVSLKSVKGTVLLSSLELFCGVSGFFISGVLVSLASEILRKEDTVMEGSFLSGLQAC